jgi:hypothetical protein
MKSSKAKFLIPVILLLSSPGFSNQAEIVDVKVANNQGSYRFDVTLRHGDTGWDHYADGWEVISTSGDVLGKRVLAHPHVGEQPFTRSLSGVKVPQGTSSVSIRAHDSVHGYNKKVFEVKLP